MPADAEGYEAGSQMKSLVQRDWAPCMAGEKVNSLGHGGTYSPTCTATNCWSP